MTVSYNTGPTCFQVPIYMPTKFYLCMVLVPFELDTILIVSKAIVKLRQRNAFLNRNQSRWEEPSLEEESG
jgi:hypothetical protein